MTKVVVLSYYPLPYSKTGSWTTLYKNYITQHQHLIDYIVCPEPHQRFDQVGYSPVDNSFPTRLQRKFSGKKYSAYFKAIKRIVRPGEKYVVQIVDNQGITAPLDAFLKEHH